MIYTTCLRCWVSLLLNQDIVRITEENKSFLRQRLLVLSCAHRLLNRRCQMLTGSSVLKNTKKCFQSLSILPSLFGYISQQTTYMLLHFRMNITFSRQSLLLLSYVYAVLILNQRFQVPTGASVLRYTENPASFSFSKHASYTNFLLIMENSICLSGWFRKNFTN